MTEDEQGFAAMWRDFGDGSITNDDWQTLLQTIPGLRQWVRRERQRDMLHDKANSHRAMRWR